MMVDFGVPGYVNSSRLPADSLRRLQHNQTGGARGVVRPGDLKVSALTVPGAGVRIGPGDDLIPCRAPDRTRETYSVPLFAEDIYMGDGGEGLPGTGSSGGRRDMIIHEITDPALPRTYTPRSEIPEGVLSKITVVPGVSSTARTVDDVPALANVTCYELAMITYPANTATVTNAMIRDLRRLAQPKRDIHTRNYELVSGQSSALTNTNAYPVGATWPSYAEVDESWSAILIPEWATHMRIVMTWNGVYIPGGSAEGWVWVQVGQNTNADRVVTQGRRWHTQREGWRATGTYRVPASMRGTVQSFNPRGTKLSGTNAAAPVLDASSGLDLLVEFWEEAA